MEIQREIPDYCHLHDLDLALAIPLIRALTNSKIIYDSHEVFTRDQISMGSHLPKIVSGMVAYLTEFAENTLLKACHHIITAVDTDERAYRSVGTPRTNVFNYPSFSVFETDPQKVKRSSRKYRDKLPIIYQGTISIDRGVLDMIDALFLVKKQEPRVFLRLIGNINPALKKIAKERIAMLGLQKDVEIEEWKRHDQIALDMKTSLIGLVPLRPNEKFNRALPIKLLEYMACGLPVVAASLPLVSKYIHDSHAGLLYEAARPEAMARCVLDLLTDPERRAQMGRNGIRAVREKWNWDKMENVLWQIYESLGSNTGECV